jgi:nitrate reductase gamma subunit
LVTVIIFYGSIVFFIVVSLLRGARFLRAPIPLRWELYREGRVYESSKRGYGHSVGARKSRAGMKDILFLYDYYRNLKGFWLPLYAFHLGIYLLLAWHIWLFVAATLGKGMDPKYGLLLGHTATTIAFTGGVGILGLRIFNKEMRAYYTRFHYFKWLVILALLVQGYLVVFSYFGNDMNGVIAYVEKQLSFDWAYKFNSPLPTSLHVLLASAWLLYLPYSHLMRLVFRYYHELRWDNALNTKGSRLERKISLNLARPVTWSAAHISQSHTWAALMEKNGGSKGADNA